MTYYRLYWYALLLALYKIKIMAKLRQKNLVLRIDKLHNFGLLNFSSILNSYIHKMLQQNALTPKSFLKTPQLREKYECWICYEVCIKPVRCKGTCGHIFCMKCVSDTRNNNNDRCPSRCSSPFLVDCLPEIEIQFYCPYNPSQCPALITSVAAFHSHYKSCQFVSKEELVLKQLQNEYRCLKGHFLQFYVGSYQEMINSKCAYCQESKLCRSFCRICDQFYCICCRIPPCSKQGCPINHPFSFQRIAAINYICDICGISTAVSNGGVYDDNVCNFGLCESCFQALPQKYDQSKPRSIVANISNKCSCGCELVTINAVHKKSICELCKKLKECIRYCQNCDKSYCVSCKMIDIYSDSTCGSDHQLIKVTAAQNQVFMRVERQFGCMRCLCKKDVYFFDQKCFLRLCQECLLHFMKVTTDKQRPVSLTCDKNHILNYINEDDTYQEVCCKCKKTKLIRLACISCEQDQRLYCFECKPIPLRTCYFKHTLKQFKLDKMRECQFCRQGSTQLLGCNKCSFFVCSGCVDKTLEEKVEQNQMIEEE